MSQFVISSSYGNDSVALIQWAYERGLRGVTVVYCDTGWASPGWPRRVIECERFVKGLGYTPVQTKSIGMAELVRIKDGFPGNAQQFCTAHLKGLPFAEWIDDFDKDCNAVVMIGKRRAESPKRRNTREIVGEGSEFHGGRKLWHPLYEHSDERRNELIKRAGFEVLPHRSLECNPCVNANRADLLRLTPGEIERVNDLEVEVNRTMFRPKKKGALGIYGVIHIAKHGKGDFDEEVAACDSLFGCGL